MSELLLVGFLGGGVAAAAATLAFPLVRRIAMAVRAVDYPGGRHVHREAIPRMGGIAIGAGIAAGLALPVALLWKDCVGAVTPLQALTLLLGTCLIFIIGLVDDTVGLTPMQRFVVQVFAAAGVVYAGWSFSVLYVPLFGEIHLAFWGGLVTIVWIVGVTNAINLLDGLDGLAGGVAAIIATSLVVFAWIQGNPVTFILMSAIVGSCLGFLRHNWAPAKIYMGDSGSLTLGFLLSVMSMNASMKGAAAVAILVPILALGLPVIDTLLVMVVRFVEKPQGSALRRFGRMFQADRNHVHHLMARTAPSRKQIVLVIYCVAASFCLMALLVAVSRSAVLGVALVIVEVAVVALMRNTGIDSRARVLSLEQRRKVRAHFQIEDDKDQEVPLKYAARR